MILIESLSWQAEGSSFSYAILRGISGLTYAKERGIINITVMDQVPVVSSVHKRVK
jgi:hypothetical protein